MKWETCPCERVREEVSLLVCERARGDEVGVAAGSDVINTFVGQVKV